MQLFNNIKSKGEISCPHEEHKCVIVYQVAMSFTITCVLALLEQEQCFIIKCIIILPSCLSLAASTESLHICLAFRISSKNSP